MQQAKQQQPSTAYAVSPAEAAVLNNMLAMLTRQRQAYDAELQRREATTTTEAEVKTSKAYDGVKTERLLALIHSNVYYSLRIAKRLYQQGTPKSGHHQEAVRPSQEALQLARQFRQLMTEASAKAASLAQAGQTQRVADTTPDPLAQVDVKQQPPATAKLRWS